MTSQTNKPTKHDQTLVSFAGRIRSYVQTDLDNGWQRISTLRIDNQVLSSVTIPEHLLHFAAPGCNGTFHFLKTRGDPSKVHDRKDRSTLVLVAAQFPNDEGVIIDFSPVRGWLKWIHRKLFVALVCIFSTVSFAWWLADGSGWFMSDLIYATAFTPAILASIWGISIATDPRYRIWKRLVNAFDRELPDIQRRIREDTRTD